MELEWRQAGFLRVKLQALERDNDRRRVIAERFCREIAHPRVVLPQLPAEPRSHVWHLFVVSTPQRASLMGHLESAGIEVLIHYPRAIHRQEAYASSAASRATLPVSERLQDQVLSLPISPVMSDAQVSRVIYALNSWAT